MTIQIGKEYDFRIKSNCRRPDHVSRVRVVEIRDMPAEGIRIVTCRRNDNGAVVVAFDDELTPIS